METYLKNAGFEFVGTQYVPLVPTSPPTTQLMWLKQNKVDLALGIMINPGAQPTVKEMARLGMGPDQPYKMVFACGTPAHIVPFVDAMGELGDGYVVAGDFPSWDDSAPGVKWMVELQKKNHPDKFIRHTQYMSGMIEALTQLEALKLALEKTPLEKLKPMDVLNNGFYKIKNLDTGGITSSPLTYGPGKIEGVDSMRIDQVVKGKIVNKGVFPCRHVYKH